MSGPAPVIVLHGASSAGKSTLAKALQDCLQDPFWHVSIDHLRDGGVLPDARLARGDFARRDLRAPFFDGFHASVVAFAEAGNALIVEHIFETPQMRDAVRALWAPLHPFYVAVHTSIDTLIAREARRGDRPPGSAANDFTRVHVGMDYDHEVLGTAPADANAAEICRAWQDRDTR